MSDSQELGKLSCNEELNEVIVNVVIVIGQSNSEESQSSENEGDNLSDSDDKRRSCTNEEIMYRIDYMLCNTDRVIGQRTVARRG